jgi:hypothetical protein
MTLQFDHAATGVATVRLGPAGRCLTYRCDASRHRVIATDEFGRAVFAFGSRGSRPGQFHTPIDLTFVRPEFAGEALPTCGPEAVWLAVADYGNRRVQIFDLDGVHVGCVDLERRIAIGPPCGLHWRAPLLEIDGVEGARTTVNLAAALLCEAPLSRPPAPLPREWANSRQWVH